MQGRHAHSPECDIATNPKGLDKVRAGRDHHRHHHHHTIIIIIITLIIIRHNNASASTTVEWRQGMTPRLTD
jgi:hypothetical protein